MDFKSCFTTLFLLLLLLLLATPHFSFGRSGSSMEMMGGADVYEIDYRGPETHSSIPPPDHSRGKPRIHRERTMALPKSKDSRGGGRGGGNTAVANENKIHG